MDGTQGRTEPGADIDQLAREVIGAAIEVHRSLGAGFLESVYEEALCVELAFRGLPFTRQQTFGLNYRGHAVGQARLDLLVGGRLLVELKAVETLLPLHSAQVLSYLKMTGLQLGLLLNFNVPMLRNGGIKRIVLS